MRLALLMCSLVLNAQGKQKVDAKRIRELSSSMPVGIIVFLLIRSPLGTGFPFLKLSLKLWWFWRAGNFCCSVANTFWGDNPGKRELLTLVNNTICIKLHIQHLYSQLIDLFKAVLLQATFGENFFRALFIIFRWVLGGIRIDWSFTWTHDQNFYWRWMRFFLLFVTVLKISLTGFYMVDLEQQLKISYF